MKAPFLVPTLRVGMPSSTLGVVRPRGKQSVRGSRRHAGLLMLRDVHATNEGMVSMRAESRALTCRADHNGVTTVVRPWVRRGTTSLARAVRPPQRIGLTPEVGGLASRLNHALTGVVTRVALGIPCRIRVAPEVTSGVRPWVARGSSYFARQCDLPPRSSGSRPRLEDLRPV